MCETFVQFALVHGIPVENPSLLNFGAFTEFLLSEHTHPATIKSYWTAIKAVYKWWARQGVVDRLSSQAAQQIIKG